MAGDVARMREERARHERRAADLGKAIAAAEAGDKPRGWIIRRRADSAIVGYSIAWTEEEAIDGYPDGDEDKLTAELYVPEPAAPAISEDDPVQVVLATLARDASERRTTCLAFVTRRWSSGLEADPFPSDAVLWAIYLEHESELWEMAESGDHEAWDTDMGAADALDGAARAVREAFGLPEPEPKEEE